MKNAFKNKSVNCNVTKAMLETAGEYTVQLL